MMTIVSLRVSLRVLTDCVCFDEVHMFYTMFSFLGGVALLFSPYDPRYCSHPAWSFGIQYNPVVRSRSRSRSGEKTLVS